MLFEAIYDSVCTKWNKSYERTTVRQSNKVWASEKCSSEAELSAHRTFLFLSFTLCAAAALVEFLFYWYHYKTVEQIIVYSDRKATFRPTEMAQHKLMSLVFITWAPTDWITLKATLHNRILRKQQLLSNPQYGHNYGASLIVMRPRGRSV